MVCRASGRYGRGFKLQRGVTQGGPLSPKIFNIMVDAITREWIRQVLGEEAICEGYGRSVQAFFAIFYADDGFVGSRDNNKLQASINILVDLLERVGLRTNTKKTEEMTCIPGKIRTTWSEEAYTQSRQGFNTPKEWTQRRVECSKCGASMMAASLPNHTERLHDIYKNLCIILYFSLTKNSIKKIY